MISATVSKNISPRLLTAAYYLSFIIIGLQTATEGPSLPTLARHTSSGLEEISLIFVFGSIGYMTGSLLGGRAYDKFPGHRIMASSLLVIIVTMVIVPLVSTLWLLLLTLFILGLAKGALEVGCNTLLQWVHGDKTGPYMNGLHFSFGIGTFLSPLLLAQVITITQDIYWGFWTISIVALPLAIWLWSLPEPIHGRTALGTRAVVPFIPALLIFLAFLLYVGAEIGFGNWIYTYSTITGLATTVTSAYLTSAFWGLFTIGRLVGIWISTRLRSRTILFMDLAGCLASVGLILFSGKSTLILWVGTIGLGLSMASVFPTILVLAGESMKITGAVTGWFMVGAGMGGMLIPWMIGQIFTPAGPNSMMAIIFIALIAEMLIFLYFVYGLRR